MSKSGAGDAEVVFLGNVLWFGMDVLRDLRLWIDCMKNYCFNDFL